MGTPGASSIRQQVRPHSPPLEGAGLQATRAEAAECFHAQVGRSKGLTSSAALGSPGASTSQAEAQPPDRRPMQPGRPPSIHRHRVLAAPFPTALTLLSCVPCRSATWPMTRLSSGGRSGGWSCGCGSLRCSGSSYTRPSEGKHMREQATREPRGEGRG